MSGYIELLEGGGFKKGRVNPYTKADAVYYKTIKGPKCKCNEKSPSLGVKVYGGQHELTRFEFTIYGELKNGTWLRLDLYSINEEQLTNLNYYVRLAEAIWLAAYSEEQSD